MPLSQLASSGAGIQIHVEDLAAHLAGHEPNGDSNRRWDLLEPEYQPLADKVSSSS